MNTLGSNNVVFKNDTPTPTPTQAPAWWDKPEMKEILGVVVGGAVILGAAIYYTCRKCRTVTTEDMDGMRERFISPMTEDVKPMDAEGLSKISGSTMRWANEILSGPKTPEHFSTDTQFFELKGEDGKVRGIIDDNFYDNIDKTFSDPQATKLIVETWMDAKVKYHDAILQLKTGQNLPKAFQQREYDKIREDIKSYMKLEDDMYTANDRLTAAERKLGQFRNATKGTWFYIEDEEKRKETWKELAKEVRIQQAEYSDARQEFIKAVKTSPYKETYNGYRDLEDNLQKAERMMFDIVTDDPGSSIDPPLESDELMEMAEDLADANVSRSLQLASANAMSGTSGWQSKRQATKEDQAQARRMWKNGNNTLGHKISGRFYSSKSRSKSRVVFSDRSVDTWQVKNWQQSSTYYKIGEVGDTVEAVKPGTTIHSGTFYSEGTITKVNLQPDLRTEEEKKQQEGWKASDKKRRLPISYEIVFKDGEAPMVIPAESVRSSTTHKPLTGDFIPKGEESRIWDNEVARRHFEEGLDLEPPGGSRTYTGEPARRGILRFKEYDGAPAAFVKQTEGGALERVAGEEGAGAGSILKMMTREAEEDPEAFIK